MKNFAIFLAIALCSGCKRELRDLRTSPPERALTQQVAMSDLLPGGGPKPPSPGNPYFGNAYAIAEGRRLYNQFNCSGCHFNGGGGIGPAFLDTYWIYGGEPAQIYDSILRGRPNGMPAWSGKLADFQIWQLVAYIKSLEGKQPHDAVSPRSDGMQTTSDTPNRPAEKK